MTVRRAVPLLLLAAAAAGCSQFTPARTIEKEAPPSPAVSWNPPPAARAEQKPTPPPEIPEKYRNEQTLLSLPEVIDIALRNNPLTRRSWAQARAAAAVLGEKRAEYFPEIDLGAGVTRQKSTTFGGASTFFQTTYGPNATLSWLLFDFGGRSGDVSEAREALFAADWLHNAALQNVILQVTSSYYLYGNAKELLVAQEASVKESQENYDAARARHDAGVATVADVLQAKTALSQDELALETVRGQIQTIRGELATALGVPANIPVDTVDLPRDVNVEAVTASIDALIEQAQKERPDLGAARAEAERARAHIGTIRSERLPVVSAFGNANRLSYASPTGVPYRTTYTGGLELSLPLFDGGRRAYDLRQAQEEAKAASATAETLEQQVILQVWTSYFAVRTAAQRVRTSRDLLESATQATEVTAGRYKSGVGSILDLLTSQRSLAQARAQEVQARSDWFQSLAQLAHDTGVLGPLPPGSAGPTLDGKETR
ncbi:MAG TPA: TolC family protein [Thermoanaerobaculia bacterium]|nr:TolC family protein [Thermoanaerobaculia bacterium]